MSPPGWTQLPGVLAPDFVDTRMMVHQVVQLLASFAGERLEPQPDDRHRSLCWDIGEGAFVTGSPAEAPDLRVELSLAPLRFRIRDCETLSDFQLEGRTLDEARDWLRHEINRAVGVEMPLAPPEYEVPHHPVADGHAIEGNSLHLGTLAAWYHNAQIAQSALTNRTTWPHHGVRLWPHHFDLAVLFELGRNEGDQRCTLGVGMAPGDRARPLPYWYVTPYPYEFDAPRSVITEGIWNTEGWLGVVITSEHLAQGSGREQAARLRRYLDEAIGAARSTLQAPANRTQEKPDTRAPGAHGGMTAICEPPTS